MTRTFIPGSLDIVINFFYHCSSQIMLSLSTAFSLIALNLLACVKGGPLDWARVELPWARADRSKKSINSYKCCLIELTQQQCIYFQFLSM